MVRVLTVDDHAPFLSVARELILATPGFEPAGEAGTAEEGLVLAQAEDPDLILIDVHMPGTSGIEMARELRASGSKSVIVLISAQDLAELPAAAQSCGAVEVISKQKLGRATLQRLWTEHPRRG